MSKRLAGTIVRQERSQSSIDSIFPPYSSDTESETSSESDEWSPRFPFSIDTIFPPHRSPSQSPPRFSVSIETFFQQARSPSQSVRNPLFAQKIVMKLHINCKKCRIKAMKIVAVAQGVTSVAIEGAEKSLLVVIGGGVDTARLAGSLRKKVGDASIQNIQRY